MGGNPATPSKACQPCRVKRRKCDMLRPGCSQCKRANIECGGYRDSFSLRLRDQTSLAAQKVQKSRSAGSTGSTPDEKTETRSADAMTLVTFQKPSPSPESLAMGYFIHVYAPSSTFEYLAEPAVLIRDLPEDALLAPALLLFSQNWRYPQARSLAQKHYALALRATNQSLSSPDLATSDSTLLSVLLLSLFEALIFQGRSDPVNWNAHTQGAMELLRLRGEEQFQRDLGRRLYRHASLNIRTQCAQVGVQAPLSLSTLESSYLDCPRPREHQHTWLFGQIVNGIANFRARQHELSPSEIFQSLLRLDSALSKILTNLHQDEPFRSLDATTLQKPVCGFRGRIDQYPSFRAARTMNTMRIVRLFVIQMLDQALISISAQAEDMQPGLRARAHELVQTTAVDMILEILYSVAYILELYDKPNLSARSLIYCLSGVAVFRFTPADAKEYAVERLKFVGERYGFPQAIDSANMVLQVKELEDW
ncbi:Fungal Zn(2)-Cys(6) binuclear cluster domain-containing protein [Penicillium ucsense]|uniref:Fungal Zn(2)-Cys(6) binuclear cluster domain-containing protein n=1 Tax=Penicillium ucsense TaxID=2839758 RepID=A0A8J8WND1_9EURO|nr:Fungal Zn(2)-Cys(6) binuclear cluster domain-containing protein [Penicillium ucsense]KAF7738563.1 Fungal Zn(2)-Cys(6) binuclear cluster domain-containing protein [Penicillium ucsense]